MSEGLRRIHITGGPGSGKTWLAKHLSARLDVPHFDQDGEALATLARHGVSPLVPSPPLQVLEELSTIAEAFADGEAWVSEASSLTWTGPLLDRADVIVWLDTPAYVALRRIFMRHVRAELRRDNRFPGWRRMYRFWRWSHRFYTDRNRFGPNPYGTPMTRSTLSSMVEAYSDKLVICRNRANLRDLESRLWESKEQAGSKT